MAPLTYAYPPDYDKIGSWFLGPKAENHAVLEEQFRKIVAYFKHGRESYFPDDPNFITDTIIQSQDYRKSVDKLDEVIEYMSILLAHHVVPFSSPRYAAHVVPDANLPATVGYLLGLVYNQNNVTPEASPLTGVIEYIVGQDLCHMLGFKTNADKINNLRPDEPVAWGHVTCDGSVANYEGVWMARSMKYYPLSLQLAIKEGALNFVGPEFRVTLTGKAKTVKPFIECTAWELLNLNSEVILDLPDRLLAMYDISTDFLSSAVDPWLAQTKGMEELHKRYDITQPPKYFTCLTKHYSLTKAASILGIGVGNLIDVKIDNNARMDANDLKAKLDDCLQNQIAIFGVLAIIGSTEHSAVDPLTKVLAIRKELEEQHGVSFLIHCDAAWGGYFTSLLRPVPEDWTGKPPNADDLIRPLLPYVVEQLQHLHLADSITVDSHKSGYCPYPAGGLCYRDERMRLLIAVTSPYINTTGKGVESMGTYGLEGSKPGASPLAVWTANVVIGLHQGGYGRILSEAIMTGVRYYSMWLTMKSEKFISIPLNEFNFPGDQPAQAVLDRIHQTITTRPYEDLIKDPQAMAQIQSMGADLMINTFACNFKLKDGTLNTDPDEANYLNDRIYERLSLRRITDNMNLVPFILVGTIWTQREYQGCLTNFKRRLGLREDNSDLHTFSSVAMSPFVTDNFADEMGAVFKQVTEEEVENCWERIYAKAVFHDFLMQGTDEIYLVYLPMFNVGSHRQQIILNAKLDSATMKLYTDARAKDPSAHFTLHTYEELLISDILSGNDIQVNLVKGLPLGYGSSDLNIATNVTLSEIRIIKNHSLSPRYLSLVYPDLMPFYLYGTETQQHVEHVLLKDQNVQLTAAQIKLDLTPKLTQAQLKKGLIAVLTNRHELSMQPCSDLHKPQFFKAGAISTVSVYNDPITYSTDPNVDLREFMGRVLAQQPITTGTLILGQEVYNDATNINQDIATALSIIIDEKANTREVLKGVRQASRDSDFWLSDNAKTILHRNVVGRLKAHIESSKERASKPPSRTGPIGGLIPGILSAVEEKHDRLHANIAEKRTQLHAAVAEKHTKLHNERERLLELHQRRVLVSRFTLQKPQDRFRRAVAVRDEWRNAVENIGRAR